MSAASHISPCLLPGAAPPPPGQQAGAGPWKDKSSAKTQTGLLGWAGPVVEQLDNSLLREHGGLVLDLAVQGQDVTCSSMSAGTARGETKDAGPAPQPTGGSSGLLRDAGWGPHPGLAHRRCPTNED